MVFIGWGCGVGYRNGVRAAAVGRPVVVGVVVAGFAGGVAGRVFGASHGVKGCPAGESGGAGCVVRGGGGVSPRPRLVGRRVCRGSRLGWIGGQRRKSRR